MFAVLILSAIACFGFSENAAPIPLMHKKKKTKNQIYKGPRKSESGCFDFWGGGVDAGNQLITDIESRQEVGSKKLPIMSKLLAFFTVCFLFLMPWLWH